MSRALDRDMRLPKKGLLQARVIKAGYVSELLYNKSLKPMHQNES